MSQKQIEELKCQGGVDITKVPVGTTILVETTHAVYEIVVLFPAMALIEITGTDRIFSAQKGTHEATLKHSTGDQLGQVKIPHWIGKSMRMALQTNDGLVMTSAVCSGRITGPENAWSYELWEKY